MMKVSQNAQAISSTLLSCPRYILKYFKHIVSLPELTEMFLSLLWKIKFSKVIIKIYSYRHKVDVEIPFLCH